MKDTGKDFIRLTHYEHLTPSDQSQGVPAPVLELPYCGGGPLMHLGKPVQPKSENALMENTLTGRRSIRRFSHAPLSIEELSWLLWCTQGVQQVIPPSTIRTVPSAGARHPRCASSFAVRAIAPRYHFTHYGRAATLQQPHHRYSHCSLISSQKLSAGSPSPLR